MLNYIMKLRTPSLAIRISLIGTIIIFSTIAVIVTAMLKDAEAEMTIHATEALESNLKLLKRALVDEGGSPSFEIIDGKMNIGSHAIEADEPAVDIVRDIMGGTATLFQGDKRIATNVINTDGSRAVGTTLAQGPVYDTVLRRGETYRGEATILGMPYLTIYEPIRNPKGQIIGIFYVGIKKGI